MKIIGAISKRRYFITTAAISIGLFLSFCFLRFHNLINRVGFAWDQEQFSYQIYDMIMNHKLTLLGPRVVSDSGFFLAPYFSYFLVPFYLATRLHPIALYYFLIGINLLFFFTAFFVIKKLFGHWIAIFFLAFWTVNSLFMRLDTTAWWPVTLPLGIMITWWLLKKIYRGGNLRSWIALGLTLGLFMNMHFQFIFIILFAVLFIVIYYFTEKKQKKTWQNPFLAIIAFILVFTPLVFFDLRHDFLNIKLFFSFFHTNVQSNSDIHVWRTVFGNYLSPFFGSENPQLTIVFYAFIAGALAFLIKKKEGFLRVFYSASLMLWLVFPFFFMLYGKRPSEYYFIFLYPLIVVTLIHFFFTIRMWFVLIIFLIVMIYTNYVVIQKNMETNNITSLIYKDRVVRKVIEYTGEKKSLNVSYDVPLGWNNGYSYLFTVYGVTEQNKAELPLIKIRIPPYTEDIKVGLIGVYLPEELKKK